MKAQATIQCLAPNGETGTFLQGENNGPLISPVFPDYVALHAWMKANGWEAENQTIASLFIKPHHLDKNIVEQAGQKAMLDKLAGGNAAALCEEITENMEA